jgi:hypothetical protein
MSKRQLLASSERKSLTKLASSMPKGDPMRRAILAGLKKAGRVQIYQMDADDLRTSWQNSTPFKDGEYPWMAVVSGAQVTSEDIDEEFGGSSWGSPPEGTVEEAIVVADAKGLFIMFLFEDGEQRNFISNARLDSQSASQEVKSIGQGLSRNKLPRGRWEEI